MTSIPRPFLLAVLALLLPGIARAVVEGPQLGSQQFSSRSLRDLKRVVVQNNGRHKPLDTLARETVRLVSGKQRWHGQDPALTYLSWTFEGYQWMDEPIVEVGDSRLRQDLGLDANRTLFSIDELRSRKKLWDMLRRLDPGDRDPRKRSRLEEEAWLVGSRLGVLNETLGGQGLRVIPNPMDATAAWVVFGEVADAPFFDVSTARGKLAEVVDAFRRRDSAALEAAGAGLRIALVNIAPEAMPASRKLTSECRYNGLDPFHRTWILYLASFVLLLLGFAFEKRTASWIGLAPLLAGFGLHVCGMALRVIASGRPPVSSLYESLLFVAAAIVALALILEPAYRSRISALTAAGLGVVALVLAENLPMSRDISPLEPALRSNTWLTLHLLTIHLGYSAAFLAGGLAYVGLGARAAGRGPGPFAARLDTLHYRVVQGAVLFLGTGILLGGVWAHQSWGRFWGWDPRETWSLISLLVYLVIIHGRFAGWLRGFGINLASVAGLNAVFMTYWSANHFRLGLHRDAGASIKIHVPAWLWIFGVAEVLFVFAAHIAGAQRRRHGLPAAAAVMPAAGGLEA